MTVAPVSVGFRFNRMNPGHVTVSIFAGRNPGSRGHAGELVFRTDEWPSVRDAFIRGGFDEMEALTEVSA